MNNNIEIIRIIHEQIWNQGKLELIEKVYHKDFVAHTPLGDGNGLDMVKNSVISTRNSFPDWNENIEDIFSIDNKVVSRYTSTGTHLGKVFFNLSPTGKKVIVPEVSIFRMIEGKAIEQWSSLDFYSWIHQLGVKIKFEI